MDVEEAAGAAVDGPPRSHLTGMRFNVDGIESPEERTISSEIRQGKKSSEAPLLDLASTAVKRVYLFRCNRALGR
jgi:hypothetical protein